MDTNCDGTVDWDEYLHFMLLEIKEKEHMGGVKDERPFPNEVISFRSHHRDSIVSILFYPSMHQGDEINYNIGRYISLSKDGTVNFWSLEMELSKTVRLETGEWCYSQHCCAVLTCIM